MALNILAGHRPNASCNGLRALVPLTQSITLSFSVPRPRKLHCIPHGKLFLLSLCIVPTGCAKFIVIYLVFLTVPHTANYSASRHSTPTLLCDSPAEYYPPPVSAYKNILPPCPGPRFYAVVLHQFRWIYEMDIGLRIEPSFNVTRVLTITASFIVVLYTAWAETSGRVYCV